ncbi:Uncharacterized protein APZ42_001143, partial [Daphnia magna]
SHRICFNFEEFFLPSKGKLVKQTYEHMSVLDKNPARYSG